MSGVAGGSDGGRGVEAQAARNPRITAHDSRSSLDMWVIFVEALAAALILVVIVWWTMFSGRRRGERDSGQD